MNKACCNKMQESAVTWRLLGSVKRDFKRLESCLNADWGAGGKRVDYVPVNEREATEERFEEAGAEPSDDQFQEQSDAAESERERQAYDAKKERESPANYFRNEREWLGWQCSTAVKAINLALR